MRGFQHWSLQQAQSRANQALSLEIPYLLGGGGRDWTSSTPCSLRPDYPPPHNWGADCIAFLLWCWGMDRFQRDDFPLWDGWVNTNSLLEDARSSRHMFSVVSAARAGCGIASPSIYKNGVLLVMGHCGLVVQGGTRPLVAHCHPDSSGGRVSLAPPEWWLQHGGAFVVPNHLTPGAQA